MEIALMTLRSRIRAGETIVATFIAIPDPVAVEVCATTGIDALCIDWEHAQIDRRQIENLIRAADVHRVPALVRVPGNQPEWIAAALDAGAAGVVVPRVETAVQAQAAVRSVRYPPLGARGAGPGRASGYGSAIDRYLETANDTLLLAVQVETAEGLANVSEIAAIDDVDLIFVGPGDLAVSLGARAPGGATVLDRAIEQIVATSATAGRRIGIFRPDTQDIGRWAAAHVTMFVVGADTMFMRAGLMAAVTQARLASIPNASPSATNAHRQD